MKYNDNVSIKHGNSESFISIVISAYNEEENVDELYEQLKFHLYPLSQCKIEMIFVNDGSNDKTLMLLKNILAKDTSVRIVNFIKNHGHEIAMTAGMDYALGDCVIFLDADMQHPPALIPKMIDYWKKGYDLVITKRVENKEHSLFQKFNSKLYYKILNFLSDFTIPELAPDFRLIDRKYIDILKTMKENNRMMRGLISWLGVPNQKTIQFEAPKRFGGKSKYNFRKLFLLAIDSIISFSIRPLRVATFLGLISTIISLFILAYLVFDISVSETYQYTGYGTIIFMIIFLGSVQLFVLGIIGEYLGRIHLEVKNRPLYIAEYLLNEKDDKNEKKF